MGVTDSKVSYFMGLSLPVCRTPGGSRRTFIPLLKAGFLGGILGYLLALFLGRSIWLEMHMNTGRMIPGFGLFGILFSFWRRFTVRYEAFLLLELISVATSFLVYRFESGAVLIIPACLFREGCGLTSVSVYTTNIILGATLFAGNLAWIFEEIHWKLRQSAS